MKQIRFRTTSLLIGLTLMSGNATANDGSTIVFEDERQSVKDLATQARAMIASPEFHSNLLSLDSSYNEIWLSKKVGFKTKANFSKLLKLDDPNNDEIRWVPTTYELKGKAKRRNNDVGFRARKKDRWAGAGAKGYDVQGKELGRIYLGRLHLARYTIGNEVERSCAMNTMAHEVAHTLSQTTTGYDEYMLDDGKSVKASGGRPMGSYLIGAVAQCTWLQNQGRINAAQIQACVDAFRPQPFPSALCNDYDDGTEIMFP